MPEGLVPGTARLWRLAWRKMNNPSRAGVAKETLRPPP
jgi:hypothetical protein